MTTDNRSILQKADMALSDLVTDGGLLLPAQAKRFMRIAIDESVVTKMATVKPMKSQKEKVEKIQFGSRILRAGAEATALSEADRSKPTTDEIELDTKLFKAEVRLSNELLEDSIERSALRQTIMQLMGERIALDLDEIVVNGDTASADPFLAQFDGILKQATSNVVDTGGAALTKSSLRDIIRSMPTEFRKNKRAMRFLTSPNAEIDYRDSLSDRATALGDNMLMQEMPVGYSGIRVEDVPVMPEDLGGGNNKTNVVLLDPKNITIGWWRQIRMETDKLVSEGVVIIVATMRLDMKFTHEPAVVKGTEVLVG